MLPSAFLWPHPPLIPAVPLFLTPDSSLRGNLEQAVEMHSSIKSRLGPTPRPPPRFPLAPVGLPALSLRPQPLSLELQTLLDA